MLSAVSLPLIASAAALSAALTLVSTRMLDAKRRLRPTDMAWILSMVTSAGVAPAALAIDSLNLVCLSSLNWSTVMGRDTAIFTTCVATVTAVGGGGGGGGELNSFSCKHQWQDTRWTSFSPPSSRGN